MSSSKSTDANPGDVSSTAVHGNGNRVDEIQGWKLWQQQIIDTLGIEDHRSINVLFDPDGRNGKSSVALYCMAKLGAQCVPCTDKYNSIIEVTMSNYKAKAFFFDIPRGMPLREMAPMWRAMKDMKNCWFYDIRKNFKQVIVKKSPIIWVFCNDLPEGYDFTNDRMKIWMIDEEDNLTLLSRDEEMFFRKEARILARMKRKDREDMKVRVEQKAKRRRAEEAKP